MLQEKHQARHPRRELGVVSFIGIGFAKVVSFRNLILTVVIASRGNVFSFAFLESESEKTG
jgi:hypothetical protein